MRKLWCKMLWVAVGSILLPACKNRVPSEYIQPDELEDLLYDYHIAQAMAEDGRGDSVNFKRYSYVQAVFAKHEVTEAEFDSSMVWYSSHASHLNDIYKRLKERYSEHVSALGTSTGENDVFAHLDAQGDTANIWQRRTFHVLKPEQTKDRLLFSMEGDTTFRKGDELLWRFEARHISRGRQNEAYAGFYVEFDNDSTMGVTRRVYSNDRMELRVKGDTAHAIREVGGFVYFKGSPDDSEPRLLVLSDMMLIRFHPQIAKADTLEARPVRADSIPGDSLSRVLPSDTSAGRRLSPTELRDSRKVERSIHVVKEKPYRVIRRSSNATGRRGNRPQR